MRSLFKAFGLARKTTAGINRDLQIAGQRADGASYGELERQHDLSERQLRRIYDELKGKIGRWFRPENR